MSPATIQTYFSFMRTFAGWIGKPRLLKPICSYLDDPALHRRSLAAAVDKTWRAQGVDADQVIRDVEAYDRNAAASLRLMQAFGLRFKESLMLRPHRDVLPAQQAGDPANGPARYPDCGWTCWETSCWISSVLKRTRPLSCLVGCRRGTRRSGSIDIWTPSGGPARSWDW